MTQITDLAALAGKTIERVTTFGYGMWPEALGLIFTDGTYFRVAAFEEEDTNPWLEWDHEPDDHEKIELGLMTKDEYAERQAANAAAEREQRVARDRAEYERLRAKFEGGGA
jgi:hypothetical protein